MIYVVKRIAELHNHIIPFFKDYPLLGKKAQDFALWSEAVELCFHKKTKRWYPEQRELLVLLVKALQDSRTYGYALSQSVTDYLLASKQAA